MTRREYISSLTGLLSQLDENERRDAVSYYEDYFDEAGLNDDDEVMESVDSPEFVAKNILDGITKATEDQGVFTEEGYKTSEKEVRNEVAVRKERREKRGLIIIAVILAIFASPILIPICGSVFGVLIAILSALFAIFFGVFVAGIACIVAGIVATVIGIVAGVGHPFTMAAVAGVGLLVVAFGALLTICGVLIATKLLPLAVDTIQDLWKWLKRQFSKEAK